MLNGENRKICNNCADSHNNFHKEHIVGFRKSAKNQEGTVTKYWLLLAPNTNSSLNYCSSQIFMRPHLRNKTFVFISVIRIRIYPIPDGTK
jgi:hypothetical protein